MDNQEITIIKNGFHFLSFENKVNRAIITELEKCSVHHAGTLAQVTGYKYQTIKRQLRQLELYGYITIIGNNIFVGFALNTEKLGQPYVS
jgi:predicted transcriptional regulator